MALSVFNYYSQSIPFTWNRDDGPGDHWQPTASAMALVSLNRDQYYRIAPASPQTARYAFRKEEFS